LGGEIAGRWASARVAAVSLSAGAPRSFYALEAPPVGVCSPPLVGYSGTETLAGEVSPQGAADVGALWAATAGNPDWSTRGALAVSDWHAAIAPEGWAARVMTTGLGVGLIGRRTASDGAAEVETLDGEVAVAEATSRFRWTWPASASVGARLGEHLQTSLTVSNAVPRLLFDPAAYYRAMPARSAITLALTGAY